MPEDILNPEGGNTPPPNLRRKITCEFCECELGTSGEYKSLSETAKKYRGLKEANEKLQGELAKVREEKELLQRKLDESTKKEGSNGTTKPIRI